MDLAGELYQLDLRRPSHPLTGIQCRAAGTPSGLRSQHAPNMMVQLQECQGLEEWAFTTAEMMAVGGDTDRITATGNCDLGPVGPFYKVCRLPSWKQVRFNAMMHPNILEGRVVIPGGPTIESINQRAADYGQDSGFYTSSVLGEFPSNTNEGLIQPAWLERAFVLHETGRYVGFMMRGKLVFGVDVARHGADRSVVCVLHGPVVREFIPWQGADLQVTAGKVMEIGRRYGVRPVLPAPQHAGTGLLMSGDPLQYEPNTHRAVIRVDTTGLGAGCYDALIHQHWPCEEFVSASKPRLALHQERFLNRRAEAYFELRAKLEAGELAIPRDDGLMRELTAISWQVNGTGRIVIERKQDIKVKLGGQSCDFSDALAMAVTTDGTIDFSVVPPQGPIPF